MIEIYTDGACIGNPGPGGWAAIIFEQKQKKELCGGEKYTTNNRMELVAAIQGLKHFSKKKKIKIYTDSKYLKDGISTWIKKWEKNNWRTSNKKKVKNIDLWIDLNNLIKFHEVKWKWVKGHSTNELNNLADKIAKKAVPTI